MEIAWALPARVESTSARGGLFRFAQFFVGWNEDGWTNSVWVVWLLVPTKEKDSFASKD